jgi:hypothetical protein
VQEEKNLYRLLKKKPNISTWNSIHQYYLSSMKEK